MKIIKKFENIDWDDVDIEEESQEEHVVEIPEDGETIVKINHKQWKDFVKFCSDHDFKWTNGDEVVQYDFGTILKQGEFADDVVRLDYYNIFITLYNNHTIGYGYSDLADPYDDYYYSFDKFISKFVLNEVKLYGGNGIPNTTNYGGMVLNNSKLYELKGAKLLVYPIRIEEDIQKKLKVDCMYSSFSNGALNIYFQIFENMEFKKLRAIKKYFLDTIPHCTNVTYDNNGFTVQLSRVFGLDVLDVNSY